MIITVFDKNTLNIEKWIEFPDSDYDFYKDLYKDSGIIEGKYTNEITDIALIAGEYIVVLKPDLSFAEKVQQSKEQVNTITGEKILSKYPDYVQRNMTARYVELLSLNELGTEEALRLKGAWDWIKDLRSRSNTANLGIDNASSMEEIQIILTNYSNEIANL